MPVAERPPIPLEKAAERALDDPYDVDAHRPGEAEATAVEIGISYAGDGQDPKAAWSKLPKDSIEKWPRALAEWLRRQQFKVVEYRHEQAKDFHEQAPGRKEFLEQLDLSDFMFAFLSWKYLTSEWCMCELLRVYERMGGELKHEFIRVGVFPDARFSQSDLQSEAASRPAEFRRFWEARLSQFKKRIEGDTEGELFKAMREVEAYGYYPWMRLVSKSDSFKVFLDAMRNWNLTPLQHEPTPEALGDWTEQTARNTRRADVLREYAMRAWQNNQRDRAKHLLRSAYECDVPEGELLDLVDLVKRPLGHEPLDDIRRALLEDLQAD